MKTHFPFTLYPSFLVHYFPSLHMYEVSKRIVHKDLSSSSNTAFARSSKIRSGKVSTQLGLILLHTTLTGSRSSWCGCGRASTSADWDDAGDGPRVDGRDKQSWKRGSCRRLCCRICEQIEKGECIGDSEEDSQGEDAGWDEHGCHAGSVG